MIDLDPECRRDARDPVGPRGWIDQRPGRLRDERLAAAVLDAVEPIPPHQTSAPADLGRTTAPTLFTAWLQETCPDQSRPANLEELVIELADSWHIGESGLLFHVCSPHRVAVVVEHVRGYYQDDFAADLIALLPDWTTWLAQRNAVPAYLADRWRPYANGESHKGVIADDGQLDCLARTAE